MRVAQVAKSGPCCRDDLLLGRRDRTDARLAVFQVEVAYVQRKISEMKEDQWRLVEKFDALRADVNSRIDAMRARIDEVSDRRR